MTCRSDWNRRQLLKLLGVSALVPALGNRRVAADGTAHRPRYIVRILCSGGIDPLFTTDPKTRADVASSVDVPYKPTEILESRYGHVGPQWAALHPHLASLTMLNGVRLKTANHQYGWLSCRMMRTKASPGLPGVLDIIGAHRDRQAMACMSLGPLIGNDYNPFYFGSPDLQAFGSGPGNGAEIDPKQKGFFELLDGLTPTELEATQDVLKSARADVVGNAPRAVNTREKIEQAEHYVAALRKIQPFKLEEWSAEPEKQLIARNLQRILWAMENDLSATYFMRIGILEWDTHYNNLIRQKTWNEAFAQMFARFLDELHKRKSSGGVLWDQSAVVLSSESGRHPEINAANGKDHFPECPYIFAGPCFQLGKQFGVTGKKTEAHGISLTRGTADDTSEPPDITDVGTTLLRIAGLDPVAFGFYGRTIDFLRAV
jgi:uncharacterized protein DUF1501